MRQFRTTGRENRLDADGNVLADGESIGIRDGKLCRCRGDSCACGDVPESTRTNARARGDIAHREDAVDAYARAIEETEHAGRNMWHDNIDDAGDAPCGRARTADEVLENYIAALEGR